MKKKIDLYTMFKICLLLSNMTIKQFADKYTKTTSQHVTMVAQGGKNSKFVTNVIHSFVEKTLSRKEHREALKWMVTRGEAISNGKKVPRSGIKATDSEYDW